MPRYTEDAARVAVASSENYSEALRKLGVDPHGGNHRLFRRWVDRIWKISTTHVDPGAAQRAGLLKDPKPLSEVLVRGSRYRETC